MHLSWLFNGHSLVDSESLQILKVGRSSILSIDPVQGHHQGNYSCVASNPAGSEAVHASLIVNGRDFYWNTRINISNWCPFCFIFYG